MVGICVVLTLLPGVGAAGVPVNVGDAVLAFNPNWVKLAKFAVALDFDIAIPAVSKVIAPAEYNIPARPANILCIPLNLIVNVSLAELAPPEKSVPLKY